MQYKPKSHGCEGDPRDTQPTGESPLRERSLGMWRVFALAPAAPPQVVAFIPRA